MVMLWGIILLGTNTQVLYRKIVNPKMAIARTADLATRGELNHGDLPGLRRSHRTRYVPNTEIHEAKKGKKKLENVWIWKMKKIIAVFLSNKHYYSE